nr:hypothetical protein [Tanacetum cinerariifolium]GEZ65027.1 hypothetical protein [Tanacetum cinerariifolium]
VSYRSDELWFEVFFGSCFLFYPLDYPSGQILDLRLPMSKRSHEKARKGAISMSLEELIAWEQEEDHSPSYLRSPHVWQRTSYINGKGKVLLDDFEAVGNGKDKVAFDALEDVDKFKDKMLLDDSKDGLISSKGDGKQTVGSSSSSNLH